VVSQNGADPILKYLATDNAQEIDNKIVPELQNFLFGPPGAGGFDLASLNIQRGRDHGLADYNTTRAAYGLPKVTTFAQITANKTVQQELKKLYGSVDNIDLWVGGLAEDHVAGGSVGPLFQSIIATQFEHIRDGDRLWFENLYTGADLANLENTTLAQIIARNTVDTDLQTDVFFFKMQITGTLFNDANANGVQDPGEAGLQGRVIHLLDHSTGAVIAYALTATDGSYSFDNLSAPLNPATAYDVRWVLKDHEVQTTASPPPITFTRGETFSGVNFGSAPRSSTSSTSLSIVTSSGTTLGPLDDPSLIEALVKELNLSL
jgi:peroxidase